MEDRLYRDTINRYGKIAQSIVAVEELSELQKKLLNTFEDLGALTVLQKKLQMSRLYLSRRR